MVYSEDSFKVFDDRLLKIEGMLAEVNKKLSPYYIPSPLPPIDDICLMDGAEEITKLKEQTIYRLVSQKKIPNMKKGKLLYFSRKELREWIKNGKRMTNEEIIENTDNLLASTKKFRH